MDAYTDRLEQTLVLALQELSRLRAEKILMRAETKRQCDFTLDVVSRHIGHVTELQQRGDQIRLLVNEIMQSVRSGL